MLNSNTANRHQLNSYRYQPKTAADVLQQLPLRRNLSDSQSALVAITPAWQKWLDATAAQGKINPQNAVSIRLEAWKPTLVANDPKQTAQPSVGLRDRIKPNQHQARTTRTKGTLIISCDNPAVATQLKHLRESITQQLNQDATVTASRLMVNSLNIRIRPHAGEISAESPNSGNQPDQANRSKRASRQTVKPSESSLSAIESAANRASSVSENATINTRLSESLHRLATTLRRLGQD